jgi:hypothetical protein
MGAQIIGGLKTFNLRFCHSMPQTWPGMLIASMKIPGNPAQQRDRNTSHSGCVGPKPVFEAKVFPTLQEAYLSVNARARRTRVNYPCNPIVTP